MSKAQLAATDFFIGITIFIILIVALTLLLNKYPLMLNQEQDRNEMLTTAYQISDSITKTPGVPSKWEDNASSLKVIGLADSDRTLDKNKVINFTGLDYNNVKDLVNYDFYFRILYINNTDTIISGRQFNGTQSIVLRRYVNYNDEKAIMEITLWK